MKIERLNTAQVKNVLTYAKNCMDLNPDKGGLTAIKEAIEFFKYNETHTIPQTQFDQMHEWLFDLCEHKEAGNK